MAPSHPVTRALLAILDNQADRTAAALRGLREDLLTAAPGGQTRSIHEIGRHLLSLRRIPLKVLASPLIKQMPRDDRICSADDLRGRLSSAAELLRRAILQHDSADWWRSPTRRREGVWGDQPTAVRLLRPLNDFTSHLGDIRTIRSILGNPVGRGG